jgi:dephospho-CoA kinase
MSPSDARARIERQVSREKRKEIADWILDNSGDLSTLEEQVTRMWKWMLGLEHAGPGAGEVIPKDSSK